MAFTVNAFYVTVLEPGLYGVRDETTRPNPMVILINGDLVSAYWPNRELVIRFKFVA
jgi:hypothetical protein